VTGFGAARVLQRKMRVRPIPQVGDFPPTWIASEIADNPGAVREAPLSIRRALRGQIAVMAGSRRFRRNSELISAVNLLMQ